MNSLKRTGERRVEIGKNWINDKILIAEAFDVNPLNQEQDNYYTLNKCEDEQEKTVKSPYEKHNNNGKRL